MFNESTISQLRAALVSMREEATKIDTQISAVETFLQTCSGETPAATAPKKRGRPVGSKNAVGRGRRKGTKMSAEARARISAAQKARWAASRKKAK